MDMYFSEREVLTVDLHNMNMAQAHAYHKSRVDRAPSEIREIVVIHGYNSGCALQKMVRKDFKHPRVKGKILSMNQGVTSLILKQN